MGEVIQFNRSPFWQSSELKALLAMLNAHMHEINTLLRASEKIVSHTQEFNNQMLEHYGEELCITADSMMTIQSAYAEIQKFTKLLYKKSFELTAFCRDDEKQILNARLN